MPLLLAGYFLARWRFREAAIQAVAEVEVLKNTGKYREVIGRVPDGTGYFGLTQEQADRLWARIESESVLFDAKVELTCDEFVEWQRLKGRLQ